MWAFGERTGALERLAAGESLDEIVAGYREVSAICLDTLVIKIQIVRRNLTAY
jgi:hypothetical protein